MQIDYITELADLVNKVGDTKKQILESCLTPKRWTDLVSITGKSEPTLLVHVTDLIKMRLLEKNDEEREYITTEKGVDFLKLEPHIRAKQGRSPEIMNMAKRGIKLGKMSLREQIEFNLLGRDGLRLDKNLGAVYLSAEKAIRESVIIWSPKGVDVDKSVYEMVNRLIGKFTKSNPDPKSGKMTITIEFDLTTAFDMVIREEKDGILRKRLEENKDEILTKLYKNWHRIVK